MACIRKRRGRWVVDYRDGGGRRRWVTCRTKRQAEGVLAEKVRESCQLVRPVVDTNITLEAYAEQWLRVGLVNRKPATVDSYTRSLRLHILPAFGKVKLRLLGKAQVRAFLAEKLSAGLSNNSVRILLATLRVLLNAAVDDDLILKNPADRLGRELRLSSSAQEQEVVRALDRDQLTRFLETAKEVEPRYHGLFHTMARTGLRPGEAYGLIWDDLNFHKCEIRIERTLSDGAIGTPKTGRSRRMVDMSLSVREVLQRHRARQQAAALRRGRGLPCWVFTTPAGTPLDRTAVAKRFKRVLRKAGLPLHYCPHSLRHSFASQLLQQGEPIAYVQRQLGHASIRLTVDCYGQWLPMGNRAAVDRLDNAGAGHHLAAGGSKVVATAEVDAPGTPAGSTEDVEDSTLSLGGAEGDRTPDLVTASHALSQLSYSPVRIWQRAVASPSMAVRRI